MAKPESGDHSAGWAEVSRLHEINTAEIENGLADTHERLAKMAQRIEHHNRLKLKYERLARYPWLPVEPDPPEPE
jgi:hypothetical protein